MNGVFVDSCVLLDLFTNDANWADWSEKILEQYSQTNSGPFLNCVGRSLPSCANLTTTYSNSWACGACGKEEESGG